MYIDPICGMPVDENKTKFKTEILGRNHYFCSEYCRHVFLEGKKIAYFSMEIGLTADIPTYSGGLGVLAGDTIRSSADLKIPLVAISLVSNKGYFRQELTSKGKQIEHSISWAPSKFMKEIPTQVKRARALLKASLQLNAEILNSQNFWKLCMRAHTEER